MPDDTAAAPTAETAELRRLEREAEALNMEQAAAAPDGEAPGATAASGEGAGAAQPRVETAEDFRAGAAGFARLVVDLLTNAAAARWPETAYSENEKAAAAAVLVPVFIKHGMTAAWLERYREEAAALFVVGGLAYTGYARVRAARKAAPTPGPATAW